MIILGIETSCDETALALIETREDNGGFECRVINSLVHSQAELHSAYGGVFPTLAKREHCRNLVPLLEKLLKDATGTASAVALSRGQVSTLPKRSEGKRRHFVPDEKAAGLFFNRTILLFQAEFQSQNPDLLESINKRADFLQENTPKIDRIAVTEGPGLEPALWVGINFARFLGALWSVPIIPIDHMEGHIVGSLLKSDKPYGTWQELEKPPLPAIALLVSGGHTELVRVSEIGKYEIIGQTRDDAVGEAFDKVARILELPYPGGPHVARFSHEAFEQGIKSDVKLPRPMISSGDLDFSFSGLKTAVLYAAKKAKEENIFTDKWKKGLAREFEQAVAETLEAKLRKGIESIGAKSIIAGGGVSANHMLRKKFEDIAGEFAIPLFMPSRHISGDNALMIAIAGALNSNSISQSREPRAQGTKRLGTREK